MEKIDKFFFGKAANRQVDFDAEGGEIHALLGENGAGQTTLMNILYGIYPSDGGTIVYRGKETRFRSPKEAIQQRIGMVHQHFTLVPTLTVAQNVTLGLKSPGHPFPHWGRINRDIAGLSERYGLNVDPGAYVRDLSVGMQQRVEIMKLLYRDARLLILDEPTAVLTPHEGEALFAVLRCLREEGHGIIIITHHIAEVLDHSNRVTILRDGRKVSTVETRGTSAAELSRLMIGRELELAEGKPRIMPLAHTGGASMYGDFSANGAGAAKGGLIVRNLALGGRLERVTLEVPSGAILGLAGVDGNGQRELAETIAGVRRPSGGTVTLDGGCLDGLSVLARKRRGLCYIPEDRHRDGLVMDMNSMENVLLKTHREKRMIRRGLIDHRALREHTLGLIRQYDVKTPGPETAVRYLSGGNQQKLILGRELDDTGGAPRVIVAAQPTRGLDIGAAEFVRQQLRAHRDRGAAVLLISADLEEILALSDLVGVIHQGRIMEVADRRQVDITRLGLLMAGVDAAL
jgi:simple sugar transport system ATP-binding protein